MDIRKLEIFASVARLKSFSKAAKELHMAQPAVSIAVKKLEQELNNDLLERSGRQIRLTAEGQETLLRATDILQQVQELKLHIEDMNDLKTGQLEVACPAMLASYFLPNLLAEFLLNYPNVKATVTQAGTESIEQQLLNNEIEIGFVIVDNAPKELDIIPLVSEHLVVCVHQNHRWAKRPFIAIKDLQQANMAVYKTDYFVRQQLDQLCEQAGIEPDIRLETDFLPLITNTIKRRLGISVALSMMAEQESGIKGVPLRPTVHFQMGIAKRKGRPISRANRAFLEWLQDRAVGIPAMDTNR